MTSSRGDIHNHLPGARQEAAKENYESTVVAKLSIESGNEIDLFQGIADIPSQSEPSKRAAADNLKGFSGRPDL